MISLSKCLVVGGYGVWEVADHGAWKGSGWTAATTAISASRSRISLTSVTGQKGLVLVHFMTVSDISELLQMNHIELNSSGCRNQDSACFVKTMLIFAVIFLGCVNHLHPLFSYRLGRWAVSWRQGRRRFFSSSNNSAPLIRTTPPFSSSWMNWYALFVGLYCSFWWILLFFITCVVDVLINWIKNKNKFSNTCRTVMTTSTQKSNRFKELFI